MTVLIPLKDVQPGELCSAGGLDDLLAKIDEEATAEVFDRSKTAGRKACASAAMKVAKSKTYIDGIGKKYVAEIKAKTKVIDQERKKARDFLDGLKERVRQPLTDFEDFEKARVAKHEANLEALKMNDMDILSMSSSDLNDELERLTGIAIDDTWEEFQKEQEIFHAATIQKLEIARDRAKLVEEAEAAKAEAERLAQEKAQKEYEERIAKEAADRAKREAE